MKFGKNLIRVVELSDPEWGPYWINYKFLKKKINEIVEAQEQEGVNIVDRNNNSMTTKKHDIAKSAAEIEFFRLVKGEVKKTSDFFSSTEKLYKIRKDHIWKGFDMLKDVGIIHDKNTWTRLLMACVKFYKDVLLLENFAIMNYCGFSKILKKHDKLTGFATRDLFMRNVMNQQNFTHYPYVLELIKESEKLFEDIETMESVMPLQAEERLFIEAIRDLNFRASLLQAEEKEENQNVQSNKSNRSIDTNNSSPTSNRDENDDNPSNRNQSLFSHDTELKSSLIHNSQSNDMPLTMRNVVDQNRSSAVERLDVATSYAMEAAMKLNHFNSSPKLDSVISWMHLTSREPQVNESTGVMCPSVESDRTKKRKNDEVCIG